MLTLRHRGVEALEGSVGELQAVVEAGRQEIELCKKYLAKSYKHAWMVDQGFLQLPRYSDLRDLVFRRYEQGDPTERIDWRQSARTDKIFIREREWEAAQTIYLWADTSGSMQYTSHKNTPSKAERAQLLMLALASLALRGGEKVIWLDRQNIAVHGKNGLAQIAARLDEKPGDSVPPDVPLVRHAHMVLCSDFLAEPDQLRAIMRQYTALHLHGALLHVLDLAEENFAFKGRLEMQGSEGEASLLLPNAESLRDTYHQRMAEHTAYLKQIAKNAGWYYARHVTNEPPHLALTRVYQILANDNLSSYRG
jgi:uncharacterized protein (DUF58 family)